MLNLNTKITGTTPEQAAKQLRQAAGIAVKALGFDVRDALRDEMRAAFDRPKAFTLNAFRVTAVPGSEPSAVVWAMPKQANYLFWEIEGGARKSKGFENRMRLTGGRVALPTAQSKMDNFGNMSMAFIKRVTADTNTSGKAGRFFIGTPKGRDSDGVWARVNNNRRLVKVIEFAEQAEYRERFNMSAIAGHTVNMNWERQVMRAHRKAGTGA